MVRFMARLAKLESKSPVRTLLDEELTGLAGIAPVAPVFPDGWSRSPNASNPYLVRKKKHEINTSWVLKSSWGVRVNKTNNIKSSTVDGVKLNRERERGGRREGGREREKKRERERERERERVEEREQHQEGEEFEISFKRKTSPTLKTVALETFDRSIPNRCQFRNS